MEEKESILGDIKADEVEVSYLQGLFTNITDWLIEIVIIVAFYFLLPRETIYHLFEISPYLKYVIALVIIFAYRLICILIFGKTIGMAMCKSKYLNRDQLPLTPKEKLIAVFATKTSTIRYYKA